LTKKNEVLTQDVVLLNKRVAGYQKFFDDIDSQKAVIFSENPLPNFDPKNSPMSHSLEVRKKK